MTKQARELYQFYYCDPCAAKPGSPTLCNACYQNRRSISLLNGVIDDLYERNLLERIRNVEPDLFVEHGR